MNLNNQQTIKGGIITVIIAGALCVLTILASDSMGSGGGKLFSICFSVIFFGITAVISAVAGKHPDYKGLGNAGAIVSGIAALMVVVITLGEPTDKLIYQLTGSLTIAAIALAHISLLHHFKIQNKYANQARTLATVFISIFSLIIISLIFESGENFEYSLMRAGSETIGKLLASSLVVDLAATLLVPLCNRLDVKDETPTLSFTEESTTPPAADEQNKSTTE